MMLRETARIDGWGWATSTAFRPHVRHNMAVLSFLAGNVDIGFNFPAEIVYTRMFPGPPSASRRRPHLYLDGAQAREEDREHGSHPR